METIKRLNTDPLQFNEGAFEYYMRNFNFQYSHINGKFENIPIRFAVSLWIENVQISEGNRYPWNEYAQGFIEQYKKGLPVPYIEDNEAKKWYILQGIKLPESDMVSFDSKRAFEYGQSIALSFLVWEIVIRDLPTYEHLFEKDPGNSFTDFLMHEKKTELSSYLTKLLQASKGTEIGCYLLALRDMQLINFPDRQRQRVYNSLGLNKSQSTGANDAIYNHPKNKDRSAEIQMFTHQIKTFLDSLE